MIEQLGPYRIDRLLGRGGMGSVYAGAHQETGEWAAIKILSMVLTDDGNFRERFIAEVETLKKLDHPNIVRLYGDGEEDGYLFYVMELVEGQSLQTALQKGTRFDWRETIAIAIQICAALKHAHDRGIIHRDLKPANLLQTPDDQIKLTDFGIAKLFGGTQLTADGSVVGTADFMAPEQAEGRAVTNRTDLYSLGSVMFTLLARRAPFSAPSVAQVIHKLRYERPPSVRRYAPQVPLELEQIIDQLLQKKPQDRVPTALVLSRQLRALEHALAERPPAAVSDSGLNDKPTCASRPSEAIQTEVTPTEVDQEPPPRRPEGYSWNEATVITSSESAEPQAGSDVPFQSRQTTADNPAPPPTRFTTVEQDALRRAGDDEHAADEENSRWQITGLVLALLGLIGLTIWWSWPPSADELYQQIGEITADTGPTEAKKYIDRFLERFPDDSRAEEVLLLRRDVEADYLQSRLALRELKSGGSQLEPYEQLWLQAMRTREDSAVDAEQLFRELLTRYADTQQPSRQLAQVLAATRHQLRRLQ